MAETNSEELLRRRQTFEPMMGKVQLIFGIIYSFITGIGIILACYTYINSGHQHPLMQYFFVLLFAALSGKSFYLYSKVRIMSYHAFKTIGTVQAIIPDHGITKVRGSIKLENGSDLLIESRYAGETVARELQRFLDEQHTKHLPALVVDQNSNNPRGMFVIKTYAGRLDPEYTNQLIVDRK
ncbi:MAG: hypothetical protein IJ228_11920 [Succinivibrio sp.]|nr:hypothetical protein [Succinivibrio sp.]